MIFTSFVVAGLVPPFSEFFLHVLNFYHIHVVHLIPNSIVMFSTFTHFCEMFLGIPPNLHLFHYFNFLRSNTTGGTVGSCSFRLRNEGDLEAYIPLPI